MKINDISKTEDVVIRLKMQGLTHREIAERVFRSPMTIQAHFQHIYQKCGVQNEIELYNWYLENKLHIQIRKMIQVCILLALLIPSILSDGRNYVRVLRTAKTARTATLRRSEPEPESDYNLLAS